MRHVLITALAAACGLAQATTTVLDDNTSAYTSNAGWTTKTQGQIVGPDQQTHPGLAGTTIVDNSSPGFSILGGVWTTGTTLPGKYGSDYRVAPYGSNPVKLRASSVVVDNSTYNPDYHTTGCAVGSLSTAGSNYFGHDYRVLSPSASQNNCLFQAWIAPVGNEVGTVSLTLYAHWPAMASNASNAKISVQTSSLSTAQTLGSWVVNQQASSGDWTPIGTFDFSLGGTAWVKFDAAGTNGNVVADAIKLEPADLSSSAAARWALPNLTGKYDVYVRVPQSSTSESMAAISVVGADGSHYLPAQSINQRARGNQWQYVATADLGGTQKNYVLLQTREATGDLLADAIAYAPAGTFPTATWTNAHASPPQYGHVQVLATWANNTNRSHKVMYGIQTYTYVSQLGCYANPGITVVVDQSQPSGAGSPLATVDTSAICPLIQVTMTPDTENGYLSADAIQLVTTP